MIKRLRLIDAVVVAAVALLALKGLDYLRRDGAGPDLPARAPALQEAETAQDLPPFARVLAHARTGHTPRAEVSVTGSVEGGEAGDEASDALAARERAGSPAEEAIRERLEQRRQNLQQRDEDIALREEMIRQAEERLEQRMRELRDVEDGGQTARAEEERREGMRNLVAMYQAMRPNEAARIFDRLSLDILVPVVLDMNPRTMAEIMAAMSPEAAERLTVALARRAQGQDMINGSAATPAAASGGELPALELPQRN